ncbi:hypothetical protein [Cesiribacter andamanensis]|uniref:Uncharacterized protein n=1 Tax=Cesiribacter andamanensis AMV16 TaxID=1279009 RepID=M7NAZ1_9BACT|nr:hypothetical protein [Cesiribacter andamanensis]EMR04437.1 hypothetical protein ADICEAN_00471 [Cesiribacter andamanensis AMV16]
MKKLISYAIFTLCFIGYATAQNQESLTVEVGNDIQKTLGEHVYRFPAFKSGTVYFRNGKSTMASLNLNMLLEEMQFLDARKDTLAIVDPSAIDRIEIGLVTFIYKEAYLEILEVYDSKVALAIQRKIKVSDRQKEGGYGQQTSSSSISSISTHSANNNLHYNLKVNENLLISKEQKFFIVDQGGSAKVANKANILKAFSDNRKNIAEYMKTKKIDFNKQEDIEDLLMYSSSLQ